MIFNLDNSGPVSEESIRFDGAKVFESDSGDWELALKESGTLQFLSFPGLVDIALIAGGKPGELGVGGYGGKGGKGGGVVVTQARLKRGIIYTVTIGGSGEDTTIVGTDGTSLTAVSGNGANGGTPSSTRNVPPVDGDPGTEIWAGEHLITALNGVLFGPGGGAGGYCSDQYAYYSGSNGGDTGAPEGGSASSKTNPSVGTAGNGCGGGGAWKHDAHGQNGSIGLGSSGQILIRKHREVS